MPQGSMKKFFQERGGPASAHGEALTWPGTPDGFPFRGPVPDMKQDEYEQIPLALDYHSQTFRLWEPEEKAGFDQVMDRVVNGWYMQHRRIDRWSDQHCGLVVWLEWVQIYGETPGVKSPSGANHGQTHQLLPSGNTYGVVPPGQDSSTNELAGASNAGHPALIQSTRASQT